MLNLIVDGSHNMEHRMVVSKDAKAIIPADLCKGLVTHGAVICIPDHTWDHTGLLCGIS